VAGAGLIWALLRRPGRLLAAWGLLLALLTLPFGFRLGPFRPDHFAIILFLPAALFAGYLLGRAGEAVGLHIRSASMGQVAYWLSLALLCAWGMRETRNVVNPVTIIADQADRQALDWIEKYTPKDARFCINTTLWQGVTYRGVDGGAWITAYTGRQSLIPAVLYDLSSTENKQYIEDWIRRANQINRCSQDFWGLVRDARLTHIFLREQRGALQPEALKDCSGLKLVYHRSNVWVYQVAPGQ
jgi:hypothetical protein